MARSSGVPHGNKLKVSIAIDPDLYARVIEHTDTGGEFRSVSHAVERGLTLLLDKIERAKGK